MNISQEDSGELTAIIHIKLKEEDYIDSVNKQLDDYRKKATMPGFRPGKVPKGMINKMYGKGVLVEEVNKTISDGLNNYILENKINVLGYPLPNKEKTTQLDFDTSKEFDFFFDIGIAPEFEVDLSDKISIPYYTIKVKDEDVDKAIGDVLVRFGTEENPETAEETDAVQGKFSEVDGEGNLVTDGVVHDGFFRIEDIKLKTVQKKFIGGKADDLVVFNPMNAFKDESKVQSLLHLQEGNEDKLNADYQFVIEKVVRTTDAEVNEELFKKVYPTGDITTEEAFREKISAEMEQHNLRDSDQQFLADAINYLLKQADLKLPDDFMKRWLLESNEGKISELQLEEQYDSYAKTMRWQLIDAKLQEQFGEELKVTPDEVRDKVRAYFQPAGDVDAEVNPQVEAIIDQVLQNREEGERIYRGLMDEKYMKIFKEKLKLNKKEVDSDKFIEIASNTK